MAKILPHHSLCPLIEQKYFLGITNDENPEQVLVTVNSNVVIRFIVSNAKQIGNWNSKGRITAPVIYDTHRRQYIGVFGESEIRLWAPETQNIDKVKKYHFADKIHSVLKSPSSDDIIVLFSNGYFCDVETAINDRKVSKVSEGAFIADETPYKANIVNFCGVLILLITTLKDGKLYKLHILPLKPGTVSGAGFTIRREDPGVKLLSYCVVVIQRYCSLISLWSDNKLYSMQLLPQSATFPGTFLTDVTGLNPVNGIAMCYLFGNVVAIYGSDADGMEGRLLFYNTKYNIVQFKQSYSNFSAPAQLWVVGTNIYLVSGHNLIVVPCSPQHQKLCSLIGSLQKKDGYENIEAEQELSLPEFQRQAISIPKLLKDGDIAAILNAIDAYSDISDDLILDIVAWCLEDVDSRKIVLEAITRSYAIDNSPKLRKILNLESSLTLLDELTKYLDNLFDPCLVKIACSILDIFYREYLISADENVVCRLKRLKDIVNRHLKLYDDYKELLSLMSCVQRRKLLPKHNSFSVSCSR